MSTTVFYKKDIKFENYHLLPSSEKQTIQDLASNFIKELITTIGSSAFNQGYGTTFIADISDISNREKVSYFLLENSEKIRHYINKIIHL